MNGDDIDTISNLNNHSFNAGGNFVGGPIKHSAGGSQPSHNYYRSIGNNSNIVNILDQSIN